jgi:hypothetical protein
MIISPARRFSILVCAVVVFLGACASLGPKVQGENGAVSWKATDMKLELRPAQGGPRYFYTFNLIVQERQGARLTFNEIVTTLYQPGTGPWTGTYRGAWKLGPHEAFRLPLQSTLSCLSTTPNCTGTNVPIPLWRITMSGTDDKAQPVKAVIDLSLPADPPPSGDRSSDGVPPISLR